jgi:hypothetical protein
MKPQFYFVFDVESIGLHGEGYAVGGGVYQSDGTIHGEFLFSCPPSEARGETKNRAWVEKNIPPLAITHPIPEGVRREFWRRLKREREKHPGLIICAECLWPVESRFIAQCISDDQHCREFEGPYPFHDIASILLAAGMDPLGTYDRETDELPNHNPLCDARQSARLMRQALREIEANKPEPKPVG